MTSRTTDVQDALAILRRNIRDQRQEVQDALAKVEEELSHALYVREVAITASRTNRLDANAAEERCNTLEAALGGLAIAVKHYVEFEPEWNLGGEWSEESTAAWKRIEETLDANLDAADAALGQDPEGKYGDWRDDSGDYGL